jgi:hypothetical protein
VFFNGNPSLGLARQLIDARFSNLNLEVRLLEPLDNVDTKTLIEQIVWAYSERLDSGSDADELARFQSILANILMRSPRIELKRHPRRGFTVDGSEELARRDRMRQSVQEGIASQSHLLPLPPAIAFWPLDAQNKPKEQYGVRTLPTPLRGKSPRSVFHSKDGKHSYGYFEIVAPSADVPMLTSAFAATPSLNVDPKANPILGLSLGVASLIMLVIALFGAFATGDLIGTARKQVAAAAAQYDEVLPSEHWSRLRTALNEKCKPSASSGAGPALGGLCNGDRKLVTDIYHSCISAIAPNEVQEVGSLTPACNVVWEEALLIADTQRTPDLNTVGGRLDWAATKFEALLSFSRLEGTAINKNDAISLAGYAYLSMASLGLLFCAFGFGVKGRWCGLIISEQNRASLSLAQITAWSIVLLSFYAVYASFNVGSHSGYRIFDVSLFPSLPAWAWAVMAITVGVPFASSLIKGSAPEDWAAHFKASTDATGQYLDIRPLEHQSSEEEAGLGDLVTSEELGNGNQLAITRVQNVIITATLLSTYAAWLVGSISDLSPSTALTAFAKNTAILSAFPNPDNTFTALLALSHGAYLAGKFRPAAKTQSHL